MTFKGIFLGSALVIAASSVSAGPQCSSVPLVCPGPFCYAQNEMCKYELKREEEDREYLEMAERRRLAAQYAATQAKSAGVKPPVYQNVPGYGGGPVINQLPEKAITSEDIDQHWAWTKSTDTKDAYKEHLHSYPTSSHAKAAQEALSNLCEKEYQGSKMPQSKIDKLLAACKR